MTRTLAREIAVGAVYSLDFRKDTEGLIIERTDPESYEDFSSEEELSELFAAPPDKESAQFIREIIEGVLRHLKEIDKHINEYAAGWNVKRISKIAIAALRVSIYEILYRSDIPVSSSINAAIEIIKHYEAKETVSFVNGILGGFSREEGFN